MAPIVSASSKRRSSATADSRTSRWDDTRKYARIAPATLRALTRRPILIVCTSAAAAMVNILYDFVGRLQNTTIVLYVFQEAIRDGLLDGRADVAGTAESHPLANLHVEHPWLVVGVIGGEREPLDFNRHRRECQL